MKKKRRTNKLIGMRIKKLRVQNNLLREDVAQYLGISVFRYNNYELGLCECSIGEGILLATFYKIKVGYFWGEYDEQGIYNANWLEAFRQDKDITKIKGSKQLARRFP